MLVSRELAQLSTCGLGGVGRSKRWCGVHTVDMRAKSGNDGKPDGGGRVEEVILYFMPCSLFFFLVF